MAKHTGAEPFVLAAFSLILIGCVAAGVSILAALLTGLALFLGYGLSRGFGAKALLDMCLSGLKTVGNILKTFVLIGVLTALWRASGCIPSIVSYASVLITPSAFLLLTFLLNTMLSFLIGTSFGTAATMGAICMTIAGSMGISPLWAGGAVLSGAMFGDRCSPVSTSALLVSALTETDIYTNIRSMLRTCVVPFLASCAVYAAAGLALSGSPAQMDVRSLFEREFVISPLCVLPAVVVPACALLKLRTRTTMLISIVLAVPIAVAVQHAQLPALLHAAVLGYVSADEMLSSMISGGGMISMLRVGCIVGISSCYSGIFTGTGLLDFAGDAVKKLARRSGDFAALLTVSVISGMIACNQTLAIMLTAQFGGLLGMKKEDLALSMENSVVLLAALVPWSIAGTAALISAGAPVASLPFSCFLYLVPLWHALRYGKRTTLKDEKE